MNQPTTWSAAAADSLMQTGMAMLTIDESLVQAARDSFKEFVARRLQAEDAKDWCICQPGETDPDFGLIERGGGRKDLKWFFHDNFFIRNELETQGVMIAPADRMFLHHNEKLRNHVASQVSGLMTALDHQHGLNITEAYLRTCREAIPYSVSTMRSLYYPDAPEQVGAKAHIDRSLLTVHLGDEGGQLLAMADAADQDGRVISPPPGQAVVFWGVKALWVTEGKCKPLWHRSVCEPGVDRFAVVSFNHVPLPDYAVCDADDAEAHYWQHVHAKSELVV